MTHPTEQPTPDDPHPAQPVPPIFIVSGGTGASAEQLVQTVLAQFPGAQVPVITVRQVRADEELTRVIAQARDSGGAIVHTLVDARLRSAILYLAREQGVVAIDLMGPLLNRLAEVLGQEPLGQPGRYRHLHHAYFDRVAAIEYTLAHDDGQDPDGWPSADIVLVGASRTGKTPLSMYLSVVGWKVANVPIVAGQPAPPELFHLDQRRVIGLAIDPDHLLAFRQQHGQRLGLGARGGYADPEKTREELAQAMQVFRQGGFTVIDVTDKPIELSADEIVRLIHRITLDRPEQRGE